MIFSHADFEFHREIVFFLGKSSQIRKNTEFPCFENLKKDVFEKMKLTDLNSIRLQMIYNATTNNKAALEYLLDMFDDTEEVWFPVRIKLKTCVENLSQGFGKAL